MNGIAPKWKPHLLLVPNVVKRSRARSPTAPSMAVLLLLIGISPLATDMYLASLPAMGSSLGAATATIQLTLTGFLIGHAVGQLAIGPISDGMGRRPFLIGGSAAFFSRSPVCAVAPNDPVLAAARVAQGFASAAGIVFGKAVINDYFPCHRADRRCAIVTPLCHGLSWPQPRNGICCWAPAHVSPFTVALSGPCV